MIYEPKKYVGSLCLYLWLEKNWKEIRVSPGEVEFQKLALSLHLLHKKSPCLHIHIWSSPSWAPRMFSVSQIQDMARPLHLQRWGVGALPSRDSSVSQITRKKESQYEGNCLTAQVGLMWKGDNGLEIPHVNIFKMPIASRQPFTSDICEEHGHMEEGWETETPPPNLHSSLRRNKKKRALSSFLAPDPALLIYSRTCEAEGPNLKLLQLPVYWCE